MPCHENITYQKPDHPITDFTNSHPNQPKRIYKPENKRQLVESVINGENAGGRVKAQGGSYSLSGAQVADDFLIATTGLNKHMGGVIPHPESALPLDRYRGQGLGLIPRKTAPDGRFWVPVEAGIHIYDLLNDLEALGLALPTMGAGGSQTLAGAISTGTHGSNIHIGPLSEFVRAIHLVGPRGQEWWIEPTDGPVGPDTKHSEWCPETFVVRDDDFFHAALVSVGRLGVIYSLVLEVRKQYWLEDSSVEAPNWSDPSPGMRAKLAASIEHGYENGEFAPTLSGQPMTYYSVVIDLATAQRCWMTRRWETWTREPVLDNAPSDTWLCAAPDGLVAAIGASKAQFDLIGIQALAIPFAGIGWQAAITALWGELMTTASNSETVGDALLRICARASLLTDGEVGPMATAEIKDAVRKIATGTVGSRMKPHLLGPSGKILDQHDYKLDHCYSGDSAEFFFDASKAAHLDFIDEVIQAAVNIGLVPGYISLRYVRGSHALLAMEQFDLTVAIEVAVPRALSGENLYAPFIDKLHALGKKYDGIPHWGQTMRIGAQDVEKLYGAARLERFRWALAEVEGEPPADTFSSKFTRSRGLELDDGKELKDYRAQRSGGVLVSSMIPLLFV